jgi:hypothetical protein
MKISRPAFAYLILLSLFFSCKENDKQSPPPANNASNDSSNQPPVRPRHDVNRYVTVDVSPMDMSYCPIDYPQIKMSNNTSQLPVARVIYSRPQLQGRHLFHELLKYGEPWRLGANESTEIQFYRNVTIQDQKIKPGRYIMYCIPAENNWTIVLNGNIDSWGLHQDVTKDLNRFEIPIIKNNPPLEYYTMVFEKTDSGADLIMAWDDIVAKLPINF